MTTLRSANETSDAGEEVMLAAAATGAGVMVGAAAGAWAGCGERIPPACTLGSDSGISGSDRSCSWRLANAKCFIASSHTTYSTRPTNKTAGMYTKIQRLSGARPLLPRGAEGGGGGLRWAAVRAELAVANRGPGRNWMSPG